MKNSIIFIFYFLIINNVLLNAYYFYDSYVFEAKEINGLEYHGKPLIWNVTEMDENILNISSSTITDQREIFKHMLLPDRWIRSTIYTSKSVNSKKKKWE